MNGISTPRLATVKDVLLAAEETWFFSSLFPKEVICLDFGETKQK
jgi:hypothetical protein